MGILVVPTGNLLIKILPPVNKYPLNTPMTIAKNIHKVKPIGRERKFGDNVFGHSFIICYILTMKQFQLTFLHIAILLSILFLGAVISPFLTTLILARNIISHENLSNI